jgi:hypothetical protein
MMGNSPSAQHSAHQRTSSLSRRLETFVEPISLICLRASMEKFTTKMLYDGITTVAELFVAIEPISPRTYQVHDQFMKARCALRCFVFPPA